MNFLYKIYFNDKLPGLVFFLIIFGLGVIFGAIAVRSMNFSAKENLFSFFTNFLRGFESLHYVQPDLLRELMVFNFSKLALIWLFGISVVLMPLIPVFLFFKGFALGFSTGFLVSYFNLKGFVISLLTIFPQNILIVPVFLAAAVNSTAISLKIIGHFRGKRGFSMMNLLDYTLGMILLAMILMVGILIEVYISPSLFTRILEFFS